MCNHLHLGTVQHRPLILEKQDQILDWKLDTVCVFTWFDEVVMENVESITPWGALNSHFQVVFFTDMGSA